MRCFKEVLEIPGKGPKQVDDWEGHTVAFFARGPQQQRQLSPSLRTVCWPFGYRVESIRTTAAFPEVIGHIAYLILSQMRKESVHFFSFSRVFSTSQVSEPALLTLGSWIFAISVLSLQAIGHASGGRFFPLPACFRWADVILWQITTTNGRPLFRRDARRLEKTALCVYFS